MSPNGTFMFLVDVDLGQGTQTVQTYAVDSATGASSAAGVLRLPNQSYSGNQRPGSAQLLVTPDGKYLYVLGQDVSGQTMDVTPYAIDPSTGGLTPGTATVLNTMTADMAIDPLGRFLYVANSAATTSLSQSASISTYTIDPGSGALTPGGATNVASNAGVLAADATGGYLYVIDNYWPGGGSIIALAGVRDFAARGALRGNVRQMMDGPSTISVRTF